MHETKTKNFLEKTNTTRPTSRGRKEETNLKKSPWQSQPTNTTRNKKLNKLREKKIRIKPLKMTSPRGAMHLSKQNRFYLSFVLNNFSFLMTSSL